MKTSRHTGTFGRRLCLVTLLSLGLSELSAEPPTVGMPIITPPSVSLGAEVTLTVRAATGTPPLSYQWQLNGEDIAGATTTFLVLRNAQLSDAGQYTVVVRNAEGEATSAAVTLDVDPTFTKITDGDIVNNIAIGVGAAWADLDKDGFLDLFVANGGGSGGRAQANFLYWNNGDGTFTRITEGLLVTSAEHSGSAAWGDYDNDGFTDLFLGSVEGTGYLHRNLGDGSFERIESIGIGWVNGAGVWGDYDQDGFLDLFVAAQSGNSKLFHNNGDGTFSEITDQVVKTYGTALSASWADYNSDGRPDLFVAASAGRNFLFQNLGGGAFARIQEGPFGADDNHHIGCAWGDYDNDGFLDLFVARGEWDVNLFQNWLYHNNGDGTFTKITEGNIVTDSRPWVAGSWADFDNDGDLDLFVSAWNYPVSAVHGNALYRNNGDGTFTEITSGSLHDSKEAAIGSLGAAWGDYDKDGFQDLFVATWDGKNLLYRNNGNDNHWITVQCEGRVSNRSAIGTKVRVQATIQGKTYWQMREISNGDGWSGNSLDACFGLGDAGVIDRIRIEWPSGIVQELANVPVDQFLTVIEERQLGLSCTIRPENGVFVLKVTAEPGQTVRIYASEDLANWEEKESLTGSGEVEIPSPDSGIQFYKAEGEP